MKLYEIREAGPCREGWLKLLKSLGLSGPTYEQLEQEVTLQYIYESNGIDDALWCMDVERKLSLDKLQKFAAGLILLYENHEDLTSAQKTAMTVLRKFKESSEPVNLDKVAEACKEAEMCYSKSEDEDNTLNLDEAFEEMAACLDFGDRQIVWAVYCALPTAHDKLHELFLTYIAED
jgi:hypothetical protein